MKIQNVTLGFTLNESDFSDDRLEVKFKAAGESLQQVQDSFLAAGYEVKEVRLALNNFEEWLPTNDASNIVAPLKRLEACLEAMEVDNCSLGCSSSTSSMLLIPKLLAVSDRFTCSFSVLNAGGDSPPEYVTCAALARLLIELGCLQQDLNRSKCFSFSGAFNVPSDCPFGAVAFHEASKPPTVSTALENADLLFLALHAADGMHEASANIISTVRQAVVPLQKVAEDACRDACVAYGGVDLSINSGSAPPESVCAALEYLPPNHFGHDGTLSTLAVVAAALEALNKEEDIVTCGFCGICLSVLKDVRLAERAAEEPPACTLRDLVSFTAVGGVGLDLVPIPGESSVESLTSIIMDLGSLSLRLHKPMMCRCVYLEERCHFDVTSHFLIMFHRLILIPSAQAGELTRFKTSTEYTHKSLTNTLIFQV